MTDTDLKPTVQYAARQARLWKTEAERLRDALNRIASAEGRKPVVQIDGVDGCPTLGCTFTFGAPDDPWRYAHA